jgi:hypothetical protein
MTALSARRPSRPSVISFPALTFGQIAAFLVNIVVYLPLRAPLLSLLEATAILLLYLPVAFWVELLIDRCRPGRPVDQTVVQQAVLKITQLAFAFFDYRLGRACPRT